MKALLLLLLALPALADEPQGMVISPEEQAAIVQRFDAMKDRIDKPQKGLDTCQSLRQS